MSKSLTKQWQKGKLKEGYYYTRLETDSKTIEINYCWDDGCFQDYCDNMIDEVIEQVPSYEEYQDLIQQNVNQESAIETYIERIHELEERLAESKKDSKIYKILNNKTDSPEWDLSEVRMIELKGKVK